MLFTLSFTRNTFEQERGQALVEFAIILTVVFFIIVGIFDLGRAFHAVIVIENASREGARFGTKNPDNQTGMQAAAVQEAQNSGIPLSASNVTIPGCTDLNTDGSCDSGTAVVVRVAYDFQPILKLFLPDNLQLVRTTQMMVP